MDIVTKLKLKQRIQTPTRSAPNGLISLVKAENKFNYNPHINLNNINSRYKILLAEDDFFECPFVIDARLARIIKRYAGQSQSEYGKAYAVFNWFEDNIEYDMRRYRIIRWRLPRKYRNSSEVMQDGKGVCGEMAFLYITLIRSIGVKSHYTLVDRDNTGKKVCHACAHVETERGNFLVDPAYHQFDINHLEYRILSDREVFEHFREIRYG